MAQSVTDGQRHLLAGQEKLAGAAEMESLTEGEMGVGMGGGYFI